MSAAMHAPHAAHAGQTGRGRGKVRGKLALLRVKSTLVPFERIEEPLGRCVELRLEQCVM